MHRIPAFLLVGTIAGLAGAGMVWLFTRGQGSGKLLQPSSETVAEGARARVGVPESYRPAAGFEAEPLPPIASGPTSMAPKSTSLKTSFVNILGDEEHEKRASEARTVRNTNFAALSALPPTRGQTFAGSISPSPSTLAAPKAVDQKEFAEALRLLGRAQKPYIQEGFSFREEYWGGNLESSPKAITQQLFRGNSYWFIAATDDDQQGIDLHVYDSDGNLAEAENWLRSETTGARVEPKKTGAYYVVVSRAPEKLTPQKRQPSQTAHWVATYGYR